MDLEDDTHMENNIVKSQETVNIAVVLSDEMLDAIAKRLADRVEAMDIEQMIDDRIDYYMSTSFDINDYSRNLDLDHITSSIVDDVIEHIKDRL